MQLTGRVKELEKIISDAKTEMNKVMVSDVECKNCDMLKYVCEKLESTLLVSKEAQQDVGMEETLSW